jgi:Helix-turn-helix domain
MTAAAPTTTQDFNKTRAAFMQRASAPKVPHAAFKLAYLIAFKFMNRETRTARPAQETLARDLNVSIRTVQRLIDMLQPLGLVVVPGHGPNRASTYWLDPGKVTPMSPINTTPVSPIDGGKGDNRRQNRRQSVHEKATPVSPQPYKEKPYKEEPRVESDSAPRVAARGSKKSLAKKSQPEVDSDDSFQQFWAVYPKRVAKEAARKAWAKAIEHGVDPDVVVAGARCYAVLHAGEDPRYTKHPATWINSGCWEDEPPDGAVIDETGNVVAIEQPQQASPLDPVQLLIADAVAKAKASGRDW